MSGPGEARAGRKTSGAARLEALAALSRRWTQMLTRAGLNFLKDDGFDRSAAISYYALFSFLPFLVIVGLIGSWFFGSSQNLVARMLGALKLVLPTISSSAVTQASGATAARGWVLLLLLPVLLWTASYATSSLEGSINHILRAREHRRYLIARLKSIALLGVVSSVLLLVPALQQVLYMLKRLSPEGGASASRFSPAAMLPEAAVLFAGFLAYAFILSYLPAARMPRRPTLAIAGAAAVAWEISRLIMWHTLALTSGRNLLSGSFSFILGLLLWVYVSSIILLLAAELLGLAAGRRT